VCKLYVVFLIIEFFLTGFVSFSNSSHLNENSLILLLHTSRISQHIYCPRIFLDVNSLWELKKILGRILFFQRLEQSIIKTSRHSSLNSQARIYWVKAGANGDGTAEDNPAGNITYILETYDLTNAIINVFPGVYDKSIEEFPLIFNYSNLTIRAIYGVSKTIIKGFIPEVFIPEQWATIIVRSPNVTIEGFTICDGYQAILIEGSAKRTIVKGNILENNTCAISICSSHNIITNNTFIDNYIGIFVGVWWSGSHNLIENNEFKNSPIDIVICSSNNMITKNKMYSGILLDGSVDIVVSQIIDTSNMINGKPIRYYKNQADVAVPENTSQVILANCTHFLISGLNISNTCIGIEMLYCKNITIKSNYLARNIYNIGVAYSEYLTITSNKLMEGACGVFFHNVNHSSLINNEIFNNYYGIYFMGASKNVISRNVIRENNIGILLRGQVPIIGGSLPLSSSHNEIIMNHISNNTIGISINETFEDAAIRNLIYKNNFIGNEIHAHDDCGKTSLITPKSETTGMTIMGQTKIMMELAIHHMEYLDAEKARIINPP